VTEAIVTLETNGELESNIWSQKKIDKSFSKLATNLLKKIEMD
jgi:hypothetical protein